MKRTNANWTDWAARVTAGGSVAGEFLLCDNGRYLALIRHVRAEPDGFWFILELRSRDPDPSLQSAINSAVHGSAQGEPPAQVVVQFSDGRIFRSMHEGADGRIPALYAGAGFASPNGWAQDVRVPDLPFDGSLEIRFHWPAVNLSGSAILDANELTVAASRSTIVWDVP